MTEFNLDTKIWRYLSFDKFIDLLSTGELYFSSADKFDDTWEMYPPSALLDERVWMEAFQENKHAIDNKVDLSLLAIDAIGFFSHSYQNKDKEYSFSCWSAEPNESATLWSLFTDNKAAVAISTTPRKILESYKPKNHSLRQSLMIGCVQYIDYEGTVFPTFETDIFYNNSAYQPVTLDNKNVLTLPFFYKRSAYAAEKEVRLAMFSGQGQKASSRLEFDTNALISDVVIAPQANQSFINHTQKVCGEFIPNANVKSSGLVSPKMLDGESYTLKITRYVNVIREEERGYVLFENMAQFNLWHAKVCKYLGLPIIGRNGATGAYAFNACGTWGWSSPTKHPTTEQICGDATKSLTFGEHKLLSRDEMIAMGWFQTDT